jgi:outer membrane protein assembly factor BamB
MKKREPALDFESVMIAQRTSRVATNLFYANSWMILVALTFTLSAPAQELPVVWEKPAGSYVDSCAAIDSNGVIYVTCSGSTSYADPSGGKLIAFATNGDELWSFATTVEIHASPAIGPDGTVYFGCRDRRFYAIAPGGQARWSFATGAWVDSSAAIAMDGTIYFGSWDGKFYALTPAGRKKWELPTGGPIDSSPAIGLDGTIYFGSHDQKFYALTPNGAKKWEFATAGAIISSPAINGDGLIYITSVDGRFYALNPDGREKWHVWTGGVQGSSPVIGADGTIYLGITNTFNALRPDGTQKWYFGYPAVNGAAAIAADGTIYYTGGTDGGDLLFGWNPDGTRKSTSHVGGFATSSPAIGRDGTIYLGALSTPFRAYQGTGALARTPWPKFRGDAAQTGRAHAP